MKSNKFLPVESFAIQRGDVRPAAKIIAVGGGKGGVGKSFVSSNIAIFLANMGLRTILIDMDLGAANAHTTIGEGLPRLGLSQFMNGQLDSLEQAAVATQFNGLRLISGSNDDLEVADLSIEQRSDLMSAIYNLNSDCIVLDLSAGTHQNTIDFFLMATEHVVVFTPEPSSIENAYRFMKACYYRKIKRFERQLGIQKTMTEIMQNKESLGIKTPIQLVTELLKRDPVRGQNLINLMNNLQFDIILNQTRTYSDIDVGLSVKSVCNKFFGIPTEFIGHLEHDNAVWQALRKKRPLLLEYPHSRLYAQILHIAKALAYPKQIKAVV